MPRFNQNLRTDRPEVLTKYGLPARVTDAELESVRALYPDWGFEVLVPWWDSLLTVLDGSLMFFCSTTAYYKGRLPLLNPPVGA